MFFRAVNALKEYEEEKKEKKDMKKLISLVLILCMACMLIPAVAEESVAGTWYLSEAVMNGMSMTPSMLNMSITLEFNEDGTLVSTASYAGQDETENDTWAQNGSTITITTEDGSSYDMSLTDGVLALEQEGGVMNFSRENPAESEAAAPAAAGVAAESEDVFLGDWELDSVELMGMRLTKDMFAAAGMTGFTVKLHIEPGKVTMVSRTSEEAAENTATIDSTFENGTLVLNLTGLEFPPIQMTEDGTLLFGMSLGTLTITCYMVPAAAAEAPAA